MKAQNTKLDLYQNLDLINSYGLDYNNRAIYLACKDDNDSIDYRTALQFQKNINILNNSGSKASITLYINTPGGNFIDGMSIYDTILNSPSPVNIKCYGDCSSIGSIILQAGNKRILSENSEFMIHNLQISIESDAKNVTNYMQLVRRNYKKMIEIFSYKCLDSEMFEGKSIEYIQKHLKDKVDKHGDWYLTPEEALAYGFCDKII